MTDKEKLELLKDQLHRVQALSAQELDKYIQQVNLNNWPSDVTNYLHRAVEIRRKEVLTTMITENALAVSSNISEVS